jgi:hexosaminidase
MMASLTSIPLLPQPRRIETRSGALPIGRCTRVLCPPGCVPLQHAARRLAEALRKAGAPAAEASFGSAARKEAGSIALILAPSASTPPQGYHLTIAPDGATIRGTQPAGVFYGAMTLLQILHAGPGPLPCGSIEDAPDFPARGVMLDISRDKVPTMNTLRLLVDTLAEWKVNHLQLYMEHTFAYRRHGDVWGLASPLTAGEVRALDAHCRDRCVELVPQQNSFGHFKRWLDKPAYRHLAELTGEFTTVTGAKMQGPWSLDFTNPASLDLLARLYDELRQAFSSPLLHIGFDEAWDFGHGRSAARCADVGRGRFFLEVLHKVTNLVRQRGRTPMYWNDMLWHDFPELLADVPHDAIAVDWGYYRDYPYDAHGARLSQIGTPFWFAPGTSVWSTLIGCNEAAYGSNRSACTFGLRHGAGGILNTDWGDGGHWQYLPVSFIGFAAGAAMSWGGAANTDEAIRGALDAQVFRDSAGVMGAAASALADAWQHVTPNATQASLLNAILRADLGTRPHTAITPETLDATERHIRDALDAMHGARMARPDASLIVDEFANNARMALHSCRRGRAILRQCAHAPDVRRDLCADMTLIADEHRRLWHARNRTGGLEDSERVFFERIAEYSHKSSTQPSPRR